MVWCADSWGNRGLTTTALSRLLTLPLLPIPSPAALVPCLSAYLAQFSTQPVLRPVLLSPLALVPWGSYRGRVGRHEVDVLGARVGGLGELVSLVGEEVAGGRERLGGLLGWGVVEGMVGFWGGSG